MENYIVRIYRRDNPCPNGTVGYIEIPVTGKRQVFHSLAELGDILAAPVEFTSPVIKIGESIQAEIA